MTSEQEWEQVLQIKTAGRDDSRSDTEHHPYEPTDYCVLERLANSGHIRKKNTLIDYGSGNRVSFVHGDAALYELPAQADRCFFFNPFALHTIKRVLGNIFDSLYHHPREIKLFFYYVNEEVENFLNNHVRLEQEEPIDCSDLFEERDIKERILVYSVNLF